MASGRTHDIVNLVALPPVAYYLQPVNFVSFTAGYLVGTFFLSPDNDIYHSSQNKRWKFLRFVWYPYTKIFKHRGLSHIPFYGLATKLIYLSIVFIGLIFVLNFILKKAVNVEFLKLSFGYDVFYIITEPHIMSFLAGLFLSEMMHIFTDMVYSILKPKRRKKRR